MTPQRTKPGPFHECRRKKPTANRPGSQHDRMQPHLSGLLWSSSCATGRCEPGRFAVRWPELSPPLVIPASFVIRHAPTAPDRPAIVQSDGGSQRKGGSFVIRGFQCFGLRAPLGNLRFLCLLLFKSVHSVSSEYLAFLLGWRRVVSAVTRRHPRRPVRADFPHTVP